MSERWYKNHRMEWIAEMLRIYGFINREHIKRKFGLSTPQASRDLYDFQRLHPDAAQYDLHAKKFIATMKGQPPTHERT
jgi:hypothetical protein